MSRQKLKMRDILTAGDENVSLIVLQNVCKYYQTAAGIVRALDGVDLTVDRGEFLAVIGRSGSGKSTLMNMLGCLDTPDQGKYCLDGYDISHGSEYVRAHVRRHRIGFVFQGFHLIPSLTAQENVELPLMYGGIPREKRRRLATECLEKVGLGSRLMHHPCELSGGQQQRVAIARAIVTSPPLILADEPTGNLDTASGGDVMAMLHELHREGRTIVLITHDSSVASEAGRQICIRDGKVES